MQDFRLQDLELVELTSRLDDYRRGRRSFAAQVLGDVLDFTARTNVSVTRVFAHVDADGSGDLDVVEFQTAMENMGKTLKMHWYYLCNCSSRWFCFNPCILPS